MMVRAVLFDLDGVLRHFDSATLDQIETRYSLTPGSLYDAAFRDGNADEVLTGKIPRRTWIERIGASVASPAAAREWLSQPGTVDQHMLQLVSDLRSGDVFTAVLTNGTDTLGAELEVHGLTDQFDAVFNSAAIGYAKPDRPIFEFACAAANVSPAEVFFTDDSETNCTAAREFGFDAHRFVDRATCEAQLRARRLLR